MKRLGLIVTALICAAILMSCGGADASDSQMIERFNAHRSEYVRLVGMLGDDAGLGFIDANPEGAVDSDGKWIDPQRIDAYRDLMKTLGVEAIERSEGGVLFTVTATGLAGSGSARGYLFTDGSVSPLVGDTLAARDEAGAPEGDAYRSIGGGWYVFYSWQS